MTMKIRELMSLSLMSMIGVACTAEEAPPTAPAEVDEAIAVAPAWHRLRSVELTEVPDDYEVHPMLVDGAPPARRDAALSEHERGDDGRFGVLYVDFEERAEYVASYERAAVDDNAGKLAQLGYAEPSDRGDGLAAPRGLSHATDDRISFEDFSLTNATLRKVGHVNGGCTGTLFGNRLVLTGAHCIFDASGNYKANNTFIPRRNGVDAPYGIVTSQGAVYPIAYKNDGCDTAYTAACVKNDWAILILPPSPWANSPNGAPGYMGFAWKDDATVATWAARNIGYPSCDAEKMPPASCVKNVAYGDLACAGVAPALSDPDSRWPLYGTNGKMRTGCDTSPGHSGGPIYSYAPGPSGPYLIGNTVWNQCWKDSCTADTDYASAGVRISQTLYNYMLNLRATYP